jgi:hypothetical protein
MWIGILGAVVEALKLAASVFGWYVSLDNQMRKEVRDAWDKLQIAEKDGKRADIRSGINRVNSVL